MPGDVAPLPLDVPRLTEREEAVIGLAGAVGRLSELTGDKDRRTALPRDVRLALAGCEGALARFQAAERAQAARASKGEG